MKKIVLAISLLGFVSSAAAEVYSCGVGCYTSSPSKGNGKANLGNKIGSYTSQSVPRTAPPSQTAAAAPAKTAPTQTVAKRSAPVAKNVPVAMATPAAVAPRTNTAKASGRRTILEQELDNERSALAAAQKALADGRAVSAGQSNNVEHQTRIRQLESAVLDRQQNIQALQRELGRM